MNLEPFQSQFRPASPEGGNARALGMPVDHRGGAIAALDMALARQELLAAANAANPLTRAIILHLAAAIAGRERSEKMFGVRLHGVGGSRD